MKQTEIFHHSTGRFSIYRRTVAAWERKPCAYCGTRSGRFQYAGRDDDNMRPVEWPNPRMVFCGVQCWRADQDA